MERKGGRESEMMGKEGRERGKEESSQGRRERWRRRGGSRTSFLSEVSRYESSGWADGVVVGKHTI